MNCRIINSVVGFLRDTSSPLSHPFFANLHTHSSIILVIHPSTHPLTYPATHPLIQPSTHLSSHPPTHSFARQGSPIHPQVIILLRPRRVERFIFLHERLSYGPSSLHDGRFIASPLCPYKKMDRPPEFWRVH